GVTRDRREGTARLGDLDFTIVDTAGLEEAASESLAGRMLTQTKMAIEQADAVFFLIDAKTGPVPEDRAFADLVRRSGKPVIVVGLAWKGRTFRLHDTAGLRRPPRVQEKLEKLSVADAINAIRFAEVVVLLMDAEHLFEEQDLRIADLVEREGRALVIAISKWDLRESQPGGLTKLREEADQRLPQVKGVPVIGV